MFRHALVSLYFDLSESVHIKIEWRNETTAINVLKKMEVGTKMMYGYVRVSTREQNEDRQMRALYKIEVPRENIYMDKQSGKDFERQMYNRMVKRLQADDVIFVKSIDRLGRNYEEILEQWRFLTKEKKVDIVVLDMELLDTRRGKDLMGTFLSDVVLQILSFVAENERKNIRERQKEGIEAAKMRGVQFGRPKRDLPDNFEQICYQWRSGEILGKEAARLLSIPLSTFYGRAKEIETAMPISGDCGNMLLE